MSGIIDFILSLFFGDKKSEEVKKLDSKIKEKDAEVKEIQKKVEVLEKKKTMSTSMKVNFFDMPSQLLPEK